MDGNKCLQASHAPEAEMSAPFERMMRWMDRDGDGKISPNDMHGGRIGEGRGRMMHPE